MSHAIEQFPPLVQKDRRGDRRSGFRRNWQLYLMLGFPIVYLFIFNYIPIYGLQIAFRSFSPAVGIWKSDWVGLRYILMFFRSMQFPRLMKNTIGISVYQLVAGFPFPVLLALALNELTSRRVKGTFQIVSYLPHFFSTVVVVGLLMQLLSFRGLVNGIIISLGGDPLDFMSDPALFKSVYVWSGVWQEAGWSSIIYFAALSQVDIELYDAAKIDGASILQKQLHIDVPTIMPTISVLLVLSMARVMNVGFEKVFLMQNQLNIGSSDVIATFVYRIGIVSAQYSFAAAVGLFQSVVNLILLLTVNMIVKRLSGSSLW